LGYDCVVCVKQVPDTSNVTGDAMKDDGTVNRAALPAIFNPEDLNALEAALEIRDRFGGTVTAITMGPPGACEVLRECLSRGADRVVLITDRRAAASDTLATSYILSQAVRVLGSYAFVFCGRQAIDGDTAQVGPQMAEKLGVPQVTYFEKLVDLRDRTVRVRRNTGSGWEIVESPVPVLITVLDTANEARPAAVRRLIRYKRSRAPIEIEKEVAQDMPEAPEAARAAEVARRVRALKDAGLLITQWSLDDIKADLTWCGLAGSPTKVHRIQSIILTKEGYTEIPPTKEGVRQLVHELIVDHTIG